MGSGCGLSCGVQQGGLWCGRWPLGWWPGTGLRAGAALRRLAALVMVVSVAVAEQSSCLEGEVQRPYAGARASAVQPATHPPAVQAQHAGQGSVHIKCA